LAREAKKDNYSKRNYGGGRRYALKSFNLIKSNLLLVLDREVLVHAITVIQHKHVIIEAVVAVLVVVVEQVVQQVDIIIISNNGMHLMVAPVVICGLVIIKLVVVMIVTNNKLVPVMEIVNRIIVGGTVHHETKI